MSGKRRKYTPELREQAARLVIEMSRPIAHVAAEIGVGAQWLGRWVCQARDNGAVLAAGERAELGRLSNENAELRSDRQFFRSRGLVRPRTEPVEAYGLIETENATYPKPGCASRWKCRGRGSTSGARLRPPGLCLPYCGAPSSTPRSRRSTKP